MASRGAASSEHLERLHDIFRGLHADLGGAAQRLRHGAAGGCCRGGRPGTGCGCGPQRPGLASRRHSREGAGARGRGEPGALGWAGGAGCVALPSVPGSGAAEGFFSPSERASRRKSWLPCAKEPGRSVCWCSAARSGLPGAPLRSGKELWAVGSRRLLTGSVFSVLVGFSTSDCKLVFSRARK